MVEEIVPADSVPMVNGASSDVTDVAPCFTSDLETTFVFSETICITPIRNVGSSLTMSVFESVNLLEEVKVAFITAF